LSVRLCVATADIYGERHVILRGRGSGRAAGQADIRCLTVNFAQESRKLIIQRGAVSVKRSGCGLRGQSLELVEDIRNIVQPAIHCL